MKPAVFLDRDGVINNDKGYVYKIDDFEWIQDAIEAIKFLKDSGYYVFVVTNQSGIARGYYSEEDVEKLHIYINSELKKKETSIVDGVLLACTHYFVSANVYFPLLSLRPTWPQAFLTLFFFFFFPVALIEKIQSSMNYIKNNNDPQ